MRAVVTSPPGTLAYVDDREYHAETQKILVVVSAGLLYYDYLLTFTREVERVWKAPTQRSWMNVIFYLNRYLLLFGYPLFLLRSFWPQYDPDRLKICHPLILFRQYLAVIIQLIVGVFMVIRTYVLYNFDRRVLIFLVVIVLGVLGNGLSSVMTSEKEVYTTADLTQSSGCTLPYSEPNARRLGFAWIGLLVFDAIAFLFVLRKSLSEPRLGRSMIMRLLLRDGAVYFGIVTCLTVANVASFFSLKPYARGNSTVLTSVVSSCLASRLILNMRDPSLYSRFTPGSGFNSREAMSSVHWERHVESGSTENTPRDPSELHLISSAEGTKEESEEGLLKGKARDHLGTV